MRPLTAALLAASALLVQAPRAARAGGGAPIAAFDDPAGDATGPGSYVPPGDPSFTDGDFDLRRFAVFDEGDAVRLEVTLGAPIRRPETTQRTNAVPIELGEAPYLQNVDVYVDSDPSPGAGSGACIPGRRVAFANGRRWEAAVVLTPQPAAARAAVKEALGAIARRVLFPDRVEVRGRTLVVRVPAAALGGTPRKGWGWSVHVSGARWERSYALSDRLRGRREADAFTMPVLGVREAWAFGGAPAGEAHPRVVDVLLPPGADQAAVLGSFDAATGAFARVPFVDGEPSPAAVAERPQPADGAGAAATGPVLAVADVSDDLATLAGPTAGLAPLQIGRVLGAEGATEGRVVIERVLEGGVLARIVAGREHVQPGVRVGFDARATR